MIVNGVQETQMRSSGIFQTIFNLILGYRMDQSPEGREEWEQIGLEKVIPKEGGEEWSSRQQNLTNRHIAFEKNYPKNIFIPLIQHLGQVGLQNHYETCVGTRESFEGKNVVSLAEIYLVMSQQWFRQSINLPALISNMSNKILMNSKIKKKLFHLLLISHLFAIPLNDPRQFKKNVSKRANQVSQSKLPSDQLFNYPSALIYLLNVFAEGLQSASRSTSAHIETMVGQNDAINQIPSYQSNLSSRQKQRQISSKEQYKHYIGKIVNSLNSFQGEGSQLLDKLEAIKLKIVSREEQIRKKYGLGSRVPEWSYFGEIVIGNCYIQKRNKSKLTFSMINIWIHEFKDKATTLKGYLKLKPQHRSEHPEFKPIILVPPP